MELLVYRREEVAVLGLGMDTDVLAENWERFVAFARKRVGDAHLAEDVVQESFLKALRAENRPAEGEDVLAWFYRILRRSIIDLYRRSDSRARTLDRFLAEFTEEGDEEMQREVCGCFKSLMAEMGEGYRDVLERIDLGGSSVREVAGDLGLTENNVTVRLHRARKELRRRVEECCQVSSAAGCLDCGCEV